MKRCFFMLATAMLLAVGCEESETGNDTESGTDGGSTSASGLLVKSITIDGDDPTQVTFTYDDEGRITSYEIEDYDIMTFVYDGLTATATYKSATLSKDIYLTLTSEGYVSGYEEEDGDTAAFTYTNGYLTKVTYTDGEDDSTRSDTYSWSGGNLTEHVDSSGADEISTVTYTSYTYDLNINFIMPFLGGFSGFSDGFESNLYGKMPANLIESVEYKSADGETIYEIAEFEYTFNDGVLTSIDETWSVPSKNTSFVTTCTFEYYE